MQVALKFACLQVLVAIIVGLIALFVSTTQEAFSAVVGGLIAALGSVVYGLFANTSKTAGAANIMKSHFRAEAMKVLVTFLAFAFVLLLAPQVSGLWLLSGFIVAILMHWVALFWVK